MRTNPALPNDVALAMIGAANDCIAPFWWGELLQPHGSVKDNGTAFLLDCGEGPFLVTAAHVLDGCIKDLEANPALVAKFGDVLFDPRGQIIDIDRDLDIAAIRISDRLVEKSERTVVRGSQQTWPPVTPQENQLVFFSGYPGQEHFPEEEFIEAFGIYSSLLKITNVNHRNLSHQIDHTKMEDFIGMGLPPQGYVMGGVSGAPIFVVVENVGIWSWQPVAVIYEASPNLDVVFAARINFINPNGTLNG